MFNTTINTLFSDEQLCMGVTWYISCDFQMFIFAPFIIWPMWRFKRVGMFIGVLMLAISCIVPGCLTWVHNWPAMQSLSAG